MEKCWLCDQIHEPLKETIIESKGEEFSVFNTRYSFEYKIKDGDKVIARSAGGHCQLDVLKALLHYNLFSNDVNICEDALREQYEE
jgi:hypothetical protein